MSRQTKIVISIIIPVYNVAEYIGSCLQSILRQNFSLRWEVILIDDCSTDGSHLICQKFVNEFPEKFKLISQEKNQGVSIARNRGLDAIRGKYFIFVDPDDLLPTGALNALYESAQEHNACIVKGNNTIFDEYREKPANYNVARTSIVKGQSVLLELYRHRYVRGHPWGKLYRSEILGDIRFPEGVRMAQDLVYSSEVFAKAQTLVLTAKRVYRYRLRRSGSTGGKYIRGSYRDWLESVERTGRVATTSPQVNAHKGLQLRTLNQMSRECRNLEPDQVQQVLATIYLYLKRWDITLRSILFRYRLGLGGLFRFIKMKQAISQIMSEKSDK